LILFSNTFEQGRLESNRRSRVLGVGVCHYLDMWRTDESRQEMKSMGNKGFPPVWVLTRLTDLNSLV
jgi:hypothetical protein